MRCNGGKRRRRVMLEEANRSTESVWVCSVVAPLPLHCRPAAVTLWPRLRYLIVPLPVHVSLPVYSRPGRRQRHDANRPWQAYRSLYFSNGTLPDE